MCVQPIGLRQTEALAVARQACQSALYIYNKHAFHLHVSNIHAINAPPFSGHPCHMQ